MLDVCIGQSLYILLVLLECYCSRLYFVLRALVCLMIYEIMGSYCIDYAALVKFAVLYEDRDM